MAVVPPVPIIVPLLSPLPGVVPFLLLLAVAPLLLWAVVGGAALPRGCQVLCPAPALLPP
jgi:hypothetical protein